MSITDNIIGAIDIIMEDRISNAKFDKTIIANVVECINKKTGKYRVKYQGAFYTVYADLNIDYKKGTEVYVLVPLGDFSNTKRIIGAVNNTNIETVEESSFSTDFEYLGQNFITLAKEIELSSYYSEQRKLNEEDYSTIPSDEINNYLKDADYLMIKAEIKTALPPEQKSQGDYGFIIKLKYSNPETEIEEDIIQTYVLNTKNMLGQPYNFLTYTPQVLQFETNTFEFQSIESIEVFVKNFPNTINSKIDEDGNVLELPSDIFIKNIELYGAIELDEEVVNGYYLSLATPQGSIFPERLEEEKEPELTINATIKSLGEEVAFENFKPKFYWFKEQSDITLESNKPPTENELIGIAKYQKYGGVGWECLNEPVWVPPQIDSNGVVVVDGYYQWKDKGPILTIQKEHHPSQLWYKCICQYGEDEESLIEKQILIKNKVTENKILLSSTQGNKFYFNNGMTDIICTIENPSPQNAEFQYTWEKIHSSGMIEELKEEREEGFVRKESKDFQLYAKEQGFLPTTLVNLNLDDGRFSHLHTRIKNKYPNKNVTCQEILDYIEILLKDNTVDYIEDNIFHINIKNITEYADFRCSVYKIEEQEDKTKIKTYLGQNTIKITNSFEIQTGLSLIINEGEKLFKYDNKGFSPKHHSSSNPIKIDPLSFSLINSDGEEIDQDILKKYPIKWLLPKKNSMLIAPEMEEYKSKNVYPDYDDVYYVYENTLNFIYDIYDEYRHSYLNNTIKLIIEYQGQQLIAITNFSFIKDGKSTVSDSGYYCKIVPNVMEGAEIPLYPKLTFKCSKGENLSGVDAFLNFQQYPDNKVTDARDHSNWFKCQLWSQGNLIEDESIELKWNIIRNNYANNITEPQFINTSNNGDFTINTDYVADTVIGTENVANLIKAQLTYNGITYTAVLPLMIEFRPDDAYEIDLKAGTGFREVVYNIDRINPTYDATNPFEIEIKKDGEFLENIDISFKSLGTVENSVLNPPLLELKSPEGESEKNKQLGQATEKYDGRCINIGIEAEAKIDNQTLSLIIPIHYVLDTIGHSDLEWDGNSIETGSEESEGEYISAAQVGAGRKDEDGKFTGMIMGIVKNNQDSEETGLFGYKTGNRTVFINAETGDAFFNGIVKAQAGGTIGGFNIDTDSLISADGTISVSPNNLKYGNNFLVNFNGELTAKNAYLIGKVEADEGRIGNFTLSDGWLRSTDSKTGSYLSIQGTLTNSMGATVSKSMLEIGDSFGVTVFGREGFQIINSEYESILHQTSFSLISKTGGPSVEIELSASGYYSSLNPGRLFFDSGGSVISGDTLILSAKNIAINLADAPSGRDYSAYIGPVSKDGKIGLGGINRRWYKLYAKSSADIDSDRKYKDNISTFENFYSKEKKSLEIFWKNLIPSIYTLNIEDTNKFHLGFIAQDVQKALQKANFTENEIALISQHYDENEKENRYSLSYEEFIALNTYMLQKAYKLIEKQQEEINYLKQKILNN